VFRTLVLTSMYCTYGCVVVCAALQQTLCHARAEGGSAVVDGTALTASQGSLQGPISMLWRITRVIQPLQNPASTVQPSCRCDVADNAAAVVAGHGFACLFSS
jgi:hypothetical protein